LQRARETNEALEHRWNAVALVALQAIDSMIASLSEK
jgi:hypothetical protein